MNNLLIIIFVIGQSSLETFTKTLCILLQHTFIAKTKEFAFIIKP
jgi:hypothetical protein